MQRELPNPFLETQPKIPDDLGFIETVLGTEAAEAFRVLQNGKNSSGQHEDLIATMQLSDAERGLIEEKDVEVQEILERLRIYEFGPQTSNAEPAIDFYHLCRLYENSSNLPEFSISELQKVAANFTELVNICDRKFVMGQQAAPHLFSFLVNRAFDRIAEEDKKDILFSINLDAQGLPTLDCLGIQWTHGTLRLRGIAGDYLGMQMSGGVIEVDQCGDNAGMNMCGSYMAGGRWGELRIKKAGDDVGNGASSSTIRVEEAGDRAGRNLQGASLVIGKAGDELGIDAKRGSIYVNESVGDSIGKNIRYDQNSTITIHLQTENYGSIDPSRRGGRIIRPDRSEIKVDEER